MSSLLRTLFLHKFFFRLFHFCHQQMVVLTLFELAQLLWTSTEQLWSHRVLHSFPFFSLASCESHFITTLVPFYSIFPLTLIIVFLCPSFFCLKNKQIVAHTHPIKPKPSCKVLQCCSASYQNSSQSYAAVPSLIQATDAFSLGPWECIFLSAFASFCLSLHFSFGKKKKCDC